MRLDGRRVSGNVRDIRGKGGKAAGIGIGGVIVIGLITLLMGGNPLEVLNMVSTGEGYSETYTPTAEEEEPPDRADLAEPSTIKKKICSPKLPPSCICRRESSS